MYASDLMIWLWSILINGGKNIPYNIGSDESVSIKELAELINEISNSKVSVQILGSSVQTEKIDFYSPNISKAQTINAHINIQLRESIEKTIKFYESH
jgi:dTDP-glucose 4,6-dehydratase